jgi:hypothetical protein
MPNEKAAVLFRPPVYSRDGHTRDWQQPWQRYCACGARCVNKATLVTLARFWLRALFEQSPF